MRSDKARLTSLQISFMVILFEIGSTPLFLLGSKAKQDSWLAMTVGSIVGFLLLLVFLWIQSRFPESAWIEILKKSFGTIAGSGFGGIYCLYFAYQSMRNVRDFGELSKLTLLPKSPMFLTILIFVATGAYVVWKGAAVFFRLPEILLPIMFVVYCSLVAVLLIMGSVDINNLTPVLEHGIIPVISTAIPDIVSFPFGQMLVFLMVWSLWENPGVPVKSTLTGYIIVSLFLIFMNILNMAILGPVISSTSQLPFLKSIRTLSHFLLIEKLDIFVTILLYLGLLVKMTLFFFCAVQGVAYLAKSSHKGWVIPVGGLIYAASFIEKDYTRHLAIGLGPSLKVDVFFQVVVPLLALLLLLVRGRKRSPSRGKS
ncbi:Spore germination protein YndE [compost metagenome]